MQKLHFSITIKASREKVWNTLLDDKTYREWTKVFNEGSYYKGSWEKGSKILFLGPDPKTGKEGGMVSKIAENKQYEYISIEHLGLYQNGVEDTTSEEAKKWAPAFENYTFKDKDPSVDSTGSPQANSKQGRTELSVHIDTTEEMMEMFKKMWPEALNKLKE